ncbi:3-deoxy-manno-octulosonate cytidylyltransferase [Gemmatimonas sp.]|uniref:3-deoxy-manno-octulosonate cytidylyltransferase n=1 Tax=Gemmatimonas sp. TaxID=1962908 RepID=UPI003983D19C
MSILAVIPARLGATRLPRKPLRLLAGEPLIVRVYQRVLALAIADYVVVATDHPEVFSACECRGIPVVLTREDHPSGTDRVAEVAERSEFSHFAVILNVQGDEPFVSHEALAGAVAIVTGGQAPIGTAAVPVPVAALSKPDIVKVVRGEDGCALYFSRAPIPFLRDPTDAGSQQALVRQHVGVYAYTRDALRAWVGWAPHPLERVERLEQLRPMAHGLAIGVADVPTAEGGIDTEDDLERANLRWHTVNPNTLS